MSAHPLGHTFKSETSLMKYFFSSQKLDIWLAVLQDLKLHISSCHCSLGNNNVGHCTGEVRSHTIVIRYILSNPPSRYRAISSSKHVARTDLTFTLSVMAIWSISSGLAMPALLYSTTKTYNNNISSSTACLLLWPDGESYVSLMDHVYQIIYLLVTYILPLLGLSCTYSYLSRTLWRLQWQPAVMREPDRRAKKEMRKVAKMFIVILILFGVCWLPYHCYFLVQFYYPVIV